MLKHTVNETRHSNQHWRKNMKKLTNSLNINICIKKGRNGTFEKKWKKNEGKIFRTKIRWHARPIDDVVRMRHGSDWFRNRPAQVVNAFSSFRSNYRVHSHSLWLENITSVKRENPRVDRGQTALSLLPLSSSTFPHLLWFVEGEIWRRGMMTGADCFW